MVRLAIGELEVSAIAGTFPNKNDVPVFGDVYCNEIGYCCTVQMVNHRRFPFLELIGNPRMLRSAVIDQCPIQKYVGTLSPLPWDLSLSGQNA
jgi:hypothetical protein